MNEEKDWLFDEEMLESVRRFEEMQKKNLHYFFDVHELEDIINYYFEINNNKQASFAAEYAFRLYPESTAIQLKFAHHLIYRGKHDESIKLLDFIESTEGANYEISVLKGTAFNLLGRTEEAKNQFDRAVALSEGYKDEVLYNIGMSFVDKGHYLTAIDYFKEAHSICSDNTNILYDLAFACEKAGLYEDSILYYNKYLDEDPYTENVWFNLAIVLNSVGKLDEALEAYDFAIAINPDFASAYFNKASLLFNNDKFQEALDVYKEYNIIDPQNAQILCYMGECYLRLNNNQEALKMLKKSVQIDAEISETWYNLAQTYSNLEQLEEAILNIRKALELEEENTEYLFTLAGLLYKQKEGFKSLETFKLVTELDPEDEEAWICYSELLLENNQLAEAIRSLSEGLFHNPESAIMNYRISAYYFIDNKSSLAYKFLEKGLKLNVNERQYFFDFIRDAEKDPQIKRILGEYL